MKHCYATRTKKTQPILLLLWLPLFFLWSHAAHAQCSLQIDGVDVNCNFSGASNSFDLSVDVSWENMPGQELQVDIGGQVVTYTTTSTNGSTTLNGFTLSTPGYGYAVVASFTQNPDCRDFATADAIACTPACPDTPDAIGGFTWVDSNTNGMYDGEPGQPNVKIEAYDCNGQLAGTAYSNQDGQWSISGLTPGEDYRVELSSQQISGVDASFATPDNGTDVQFVPAGSCSVNTAYLTDVSSATCNNPDNVGTQCAGGTFNHLDWGDFSNGASPFPFPPYGYTVNNDVVYWSRTTDDATPYTHKVFHTMLGGASESYYLEIDANSTSNNDNKGAGVVFSFDRPVEGLSFALLDIDVSGNTTDEVHVQGFLGGVPVSLSMSNVSAGPAVNLLSAGMFQGTTSVPDASTNGNVELQFPSPVDQVSITLLPSTNAVNPDVQAIGISDLLWCSTDATIDPLCLYMFDWMSFSDNDTAPMPHTINGVEVSMSNNDPSGIANSVQVDNDASPLGGQRGFWPVFMDAATAGQYVETTIDFEREVEQLSFSLLDIDADLDSGPTFSFQDVVTVYGYLNGVAVPLSNADVSAGSNAVAFNSPNEYQGGNRVINNTFAAGNVYVSFPSPVDQVVIRLEAGLDVADPGAQFIGLSDLNFCICNPSPIQLGDRAWVDENANGIQEACEEPLANMHVSLYDEAGNLLAETETDDNGQYTFTGHGAPGETWQEPGDQVLPDTRYYIVFGEDESNPDETFAVANARAYRATSQHTGEGNSPFMNDSDLMPNVTNGITGLPDGLPYIDFTTGVGGLVNTSLDAGFEEAYFDLSLQKLLDTALTQPPFVPGEQVSYIIKVYNEGILNADDITLMEYIPDGLILQGDEWAQFGDQAQLLFSDLAPGDSAIFNLTFQISPVFTGTSITNSAEIGRDDVSIDMTYDDIDSTPDFVLGNDDGEDDFDSVTIEVAAALVFDLALEKEVQGNGPFEPGGEVVFDLTVVNEGIMEATTVQIQDSIPEGLTLADPDWTETNGIATLNTPIPYIGTGSEATVSIRFTIDTDFTGNSITNIAEIQSFYNNPWTDDQDSSPANNDEEEDDQDGAELIITPANYDLTLEKTVTSSGSYSPGSTVTYDITITNEGGATAYDIVPYDYIPAGLTYTGTGWTVQGNTAEYDTPIAALAPGASATVSIEFQIDHSFTGASITNLAEVGEVGGTSEDPDSTPGNASTQEDDDDAATISVQQPNQVFDLSLVKEVNTHLTPGPFMAGDAVVFTITITNEGNVPAINVFIADHLPEGMVLNDNDWTQYADVVLLNSAIPYIGPGATASVDITTYIHPDAYTGSVSYLENRAEIYDASNNSDLYDQDSTPGNGVGNAEDDESGCTVQVNSVPNRFDLSLEKELNTTVTPGPFYAGADITYTISVTNEGNVPASLVQLGDYDNSALILNDNDWVDVTGGYILQTPLGDIAPGQTVSVDISFTINPYFTGTIINNYAEIVGFSNPLGLPDADSHPNNGALWEDDIDRAQCAVVQNFDLAFTKTIASTGPFEPGDYITYDLTVYNQGTITAHDIVLYDYYPYQYMTPVDSDWLYVGGNILRTVTPIHTLAPGEQTVVQITFKIEEHTPCGTELYNCGEIGSATNVAGLPDSDSTPANGSHGEDDDGAIPITVTCPQVFDLALHKQIDTYATPGPFYVGSNVSFTIEVTNEGDVAAQNISIKDYIPAGLILIDPDWTAVGGVAVLNHPIANLAPGASTSVTIDFAISPAFTGTSLTNFAEIADADNLPGIDDEDSTPNNGSAGPHEDDYDDATVHIVQQQFDLALSKTLNTSLTPGPFFPGSTVTFDITIFNEGDVTAQNIQLREYIPNGLTIADPDWNSVGNVAELALPIGSIPAGGSATVSVTFTIDYSFTGTSLINYAEVGSAFNTVGLDDVDSTPGNGSVGSHEDDYDGAAITILQDQFDLALHKSLLSAGPFVPGSDVTFRISVTNEGSLTAQTVELRDYIPLGLTLNDPDWTANGTIATYDLPITNLQPGQTVDVDVTFTISHSFTGTAITNFAEIGGATNSLGLPDNDSTPSNGSAGAGEDDFDDATVIVSQQQFDLALTKKLNASATPGPFAPGSTVTFTITVTNQGGLAAQNVVLNDYVPLGLILADNNWTANGTTATLNTPIASLAPGASVSRDITFIIDYSYTGTSITNFGEVGSADNTMGIPDVDSTPGNGGAAPHEDDYDDATIHVSQQNFDLALHKNLISPAPFVPGGQVTFRISVTNEGDLAAQTLTIRDYIPLGLTLTDPDWTANGSTATYNTTITNLQPGQTVDVDITFTISASHTGGTIVNFAEVGSATNSLGIADVDSTPGNGGAAPNEDDYDDASLTVALPQAFDLALHKNLISSGPFLPGSSVTFRISVTNEGDVAAQTVQVADYIPLGLILTDSDWTASGNTATLNNPITNLQPGQTADVDITFTIDHTYTGTTIVNFAEVFSATNGSGLPDEDSTPGNGGAAPNEDDYDDASITVDQQQFDLSLTKMLNASATPGPFFPGSTVTFTLTVVNEGSLTATSVSLNDYIPLGLMLDDDDWTAFGSTAVLNVPITSLVPGAVVTRDITFTVSHSFTSGAITNFAEIGSAGNSMGIGDGDSTPGNGSAGAGEDDFDSAVISVNSTQSFDLALHKDLNASATPGPFQPGDPVTFTLTVTNEGSELATNIELIDYIPPGLILADADWQAVGSSAVLNTPISSLPAGASTTVDISFTIDQYYSGTTIVNNAEIKGATAPPGLADEDSTPNNGFAGVAEDDFDDASISLTAQEFDLALNKTISSSTPGPYTVNSVVTFDLTITNQGDLTATNIQLRDYLPIGLTLTDGDWTQVGGVANYDNIIPSLAPGSSFTVPITFKVDAGYAGSTIVNFAEILEANNDFALDDIDSTPGNGSAAPGEDDYDSAALAITPETVVDFDLALTKLVNTSLTPGPFSPGSTVTFEITVHNQGAADAFNVVITDYIPAGLTLADGSWSQSGTTATRTIAGPIASASSTSVNITFTIDNSYAGSSITNIAEISAADDDNIPGNTPPTDEDSTPDAIPGNDAGGLPNSAADNAINGDGTGSVNSGVAATDEDDHDPAMIILDNCNGLSAGTNGYLEICLTCNPTTAHVDLFGALGGNPSTGGYWTDDSASGVNLSDPSNVDVSGLADGTYYYTYTVGGGGCPVYSATVELKIENYVDYGGCNDQVNVTFGPNDCERTITPEMILEGEGDCTGSFIVNILSNTGQSLGNTVGAAQAGQLLITEVIDPYCGVLCAGTINVQDYVDPVLTCPTQTADLVCADVDSVLNNPASVLVTGEPVVFDNCGGALPATFTDNLLNTPDCADQQIVRTFTATDASGNTGQCTQTIIIRLATQSDIIAPPATVDIECDETYPVDANGNPHPSVTGYPAVDGFFDDYELSSALCNVGASYEDVTPIVICTGTIKIVRNWTVLNWCPSSGDNGIYTFSQIIKVGDTTAPVVECPNTDYTGDGQDDPLTYSTSPFACSSTFTAPLPQVTDACSGWEVLTEVLMEEINPVYDQYGQLTGYDTSMVVLATIAPDAPSRLVSGIPVGCGVLRYTVTDDCNNQTITDCAFCVVDDIEPTASCDDDLHVSIGGGGVGRVYATSVDEGSNDNCGPVTLQVRRLVEIDPITCDPVVPPYYTPWADYVDFTCCDVNTNVTIELQVTDQYGNTNMCWLEVLVEDKINPYCYAPPSTSISCADLPPGFDGTDTTQLQNLFGVATADDDCGVATVTELDPIVNLGMCGFGTITRRFSAVDEAGNQSTNGCQQTITVTQEFDYTIKFPADVTADCTVPSTDGVELNGMGCDMLSVSVSDEIFYSTSGDDCYKIFRTYRVLNMCEYDGLSDAVVIGRDEDCDGQPGDEDVWVVRRPTGAFIDRDSDATNTVPGFGTKGTSCDGTTNQAGNWRTSATVGLWEYTQIIKVVDNSAPVVTFTEPAPFCSYDQANCDGAVSYPFTVAEDCSTDGLQISVFLDANADGSLDIDLTGTSSVTGTYPNYVIGGEYPIGSHAFVVQAMDGCGDNTGSATLPFTVVDCAAPIYTCLNGLVFQIQPLPPGTDIDGDGIDDDAAAGIWANDFTINEVDCSDDTIAFSVNLPGEMPDMNQQSLYFTCEDTGTVAIEVYIWDSAFNPYAVQPDGTVGGPNYSVCNTYVLIQDENGYCTPPAGPMMAGLVMRENDDMVEGVEVSLSGQMSMMMMTNLSGSYEFDDLDTGHDYSITPYLNIEHRNGVSTFDILLIQQHLLGVTPLGSPYKMIAADVNRSNSITTLDLIQMQRIVLGLDLEFPNNTSWRFVDADYVFPVPTNPWFTMFPESVSVNDLNTDMLFNNFIAVKIGDVNNTATTTNFADIEERSFDGLFELQLPDERVQAGELIAVPFTAPQIADLFGYQFTLDFDADALSLEEVEYGLADEYSLGLHALQEGYLTASWYGGVQTDQLKGMEDEVLFTLYFRARRGGELRDWLDISSRYTLAEAYTTAGELLDVALSFGGELADLEPFELYQNQPNPFNAETKIGFNLPEAGQATLRLFTVDGRLVRTYQGEYGQGYNEWILQRSELPASGLLYYQLSSGEHTATRKMMILE